jgi:hypothetical protein
MHGACTLHAFGACRSSRCCSHRVRAQRRAVATRATKYELAIKIGVARNTGKLDLSDCELDELPEDVLTCLDLEVSSVLGTSWRGGCWQHAFSHAPLRCARSCRWQATSYVNCLRQLDRSLP